MAFSNDSNIILYILVLYSIPVLTLYLNTLGVIKKFSSVLINNIYLSQSTQVAGGIVFRKHTIYLEGFVKLSVFCRSVVWVCIDCFLLGVWCGAVERILPVVPAILPLLRRKHPLQDLILCFHSRYKGRQKIKYFLVFR